MVGFPGVAAVCVTPAQTRRERFAAPEAFTGGGRPGRHTLRKDQCVLTLNALLGAVDFIGHG